MAEIKKTEKLEAESTVEDIAILEEAVATAVGAPRYSEVNPGNLTLVKV